MKNILTCILFGCLLSQHVNSQIIYTYLGNYYNLSGNQGFDLDGDSQLDFNILFSSVEIKFEGLNGTEFETNGNGLLLGFNYGIQLGQQTYESVGEILTNNSTYFPYTIPQTVKYIGLKFKKNGIYHCAYLGVAKHNSNGTLTFFMRSKGYESNPQQCIIAGFEQSSSASIEEEKKNAITVNPNPFSDIFSVQLPTENTFTSYDIVNSLGQKVESGKIESQLILKFNLQESHGLYFLNLKSNTESKTIKLIKQ